MKLEEIYICDNEGQSALHSAAMSGDSLSMKYLIEEGLSIDIRDGQGETPLFTAIRHTQNHLLSTLSADFDIEKVNVRNTNGETPFYVAVQAANIEAMNILIKNGANVNVKDDSGKTPMDYIVQKIDNVRRLADTAYARMEDPNELNAQLAHLLEVKYTLWTNGGKQAEHLELESTSEMLNEYSEQRKIGKEDKLIEAIVSDNQELVARLIESGVDLNAKRDGGFPLSKEREMGWMKDFQCLGANPERYPDLLYIAVKYSNPEIVKMLIAAGARSDGTDEHGQTILHIASMNGNVEIMKELIQAGLNPNVLNAQGETPLDVFNRYDFSITPKKFDWEKIRVLKSLGFKNSDELVEQNKKPNTLSHSSENITYGSNSSVDQIQILQEERSTKSV